MADVKPVEFDPKPRLDGLTIGLRQAVPNDWYALYDVARDKKIWANHPEKDRWTEEKFRLFFDAGLENPEGMYVIGNYETGKIIGSTRFYGTTPEATRIGYTFLAREFWGTGLNREVKLLMLNHAFASKSAVYFDIGAANKRSRKAVEKLGAKLSMKPTKGKVEYVLRPDIAKISLSPAPAVHGKSCSCC
ncbi:GNAT family N-acetyltransferase [Celeribacter sp. ULVN23_4]